VLLSERPSVRWEILVLVLLLFITGVLTRSSPASPQTRHAETIAYADGVTAQVHRPRRTEGAPTVVLLHGCCGDAADLTQLALELADRGALVMNAGWTTLEDGGGWPRSYREATCAVAAARIHARDLGARDEHVTLVAWSDGALLASVAALAPPPLATGCLGYEDGRPDAVIALAGFFGDRPEGPRPSGDAHALAAWFGGEQEQQPASWQAGNPLAFLAEGSSSAPRFDLVVGGEDRLLWDARRFAHALRAARVVVQVHEVPGGHVDVILPRTTAGAAAVDTVMARSRRPT
jgi:acetyl esterase/lipase